MSRRRRHDPMTAKQCRGYRVGSCPLCGNDVTYTRYYNNRLAICHNCFRAWEEVWEGEVGLRHGLLHLVEFCQLWQRPWHQWPDANVEL